ncbi:MAG: hypothetical protein ACRBM6_19565 [Geminicoccales bacterium]
MEDRFGARPTLTIFDIPVVLDNDVSEAHVDGRPVLAPWNESA